MNSQVVINISRTKLFLQQNSSPGPLSPPLRLFPTTAIISISINSNLGTDFSSSTRNSSPLSQAQAQAKLKSTLAPTTSSTTSG